MNSNRKLLQTVNMVRALSLVIHGATWFLWFIALVEAYSVRPATTDEVTAARKILFQQAMNPFSITTATLIVASDDDDDDDDETSLIGFGQIRPLDDHYSELASLYVAPERRHEGVGSAICQALLDRHVSSLGTPICLLTLQPTTKFYEGFGFRAASESERSQLPKAVQLEFQAGNALSFVLGNNLVCMIED